MKNNKEIYASELPHRAKSVYMYLCDRADKNYSCYPSVKTIANDLNYSVSTVKRALSDLESGGYMKKQKRFRENGGKSSCLYTLS